MPEATLAATLDNLRTSAIVSGIASIGHNKPSIERTILTEFEEHYTPFSRNLDAAQVATVMAVQRFNTVNNQLMANRRTALALALADVAYYAAQEGLITLDANAVSSFRAYLRKWEMPEVAVTEIKRVIAKNSAGGEVEETFERNSLFDSMPATALTSAMEMALLYAAGHMTNVCIGCMPFKGKRTAFHINDRWDTLPDGRSHVEMSKSHYVGMCVPTNVIFPTNYIIESRPNRPEMLKPTTPNDDASLIYLRDDWARILFLHHFTGKPFKLSLEGVGTKRPTGAIIGVETAAQQQRQRETNGQGANPQAQLSAAVQRATANGTDTTGLASMLHDCAVSMITLPVNEWKCPTVDVLRGALVAARAAVQVLERKGLGKLASDPIVAPELIALWQDLTAAVAVDENDEYSFSPDGESMFKLPDGEPLPVNVNPFRAELVKASDAAGDDVVEPEEHSDAV